MSSALAGPLPTDHRSFVEKVHSIELGGHLRQDAGPWFGTLELLTRKLPRNLTNGIPNNFNPVPNAGTIRAIKKRAASISSVAKKGGKFVYGQTHEKFRRTTGPGKMRRLGKRMVMNKKKNEDEV